MGEFAIPAGYSGSFKASGGSNVWTGEENKEVFKGHTEISLNISPVTTMVKGFMDDGDSVEDAKTATVNLVKACGVNLEKEDLFGVSASKRLSQNDDVSSTLFAAFNAVNNLQKSLVAAVRADVENEGIEEGLEAIRTKTMQKLRISVKSKGAEMSIDEVIEESLEASKEFVGRSIESSRKRIVREEISLRVSKIVGKDMQIEGEGEIPSLQQRISDIENEAREGWSDSIIEEAIVIAKEEGMSEEQFEKLLEKMQDEERESYIVKQAEKEAVSYENSILMYKAEKEAVEAEREAKKKAEEEAKKKAEEEARKEAIQKAETEVKEAQAASDKANKEYDSVSKTLEKVEAELKAAKEAYDADPSEDNEEWVSQAEAEVATVTDMHKQASVERKEADRTLKEAEAELDSIKEEGEVEEPGVPVEEPKSEEEIKREFWLTFEGSIGLGPDPFQMFISYVNGRKGIENLVREYGPMINFYNHVREGVAAGGDFDTYHSMLEEAMNWDPNAPGLSQYLASAMNDNNTFAGRPGDNYNTASMPAIWSGSMAANYEQVHAELNETIKAIKAEGSYVDIVYTPLQAKV